ncbi:hypothetical protein COCCADRAFT_92663 [Bipolaris zeicola 26-R-13]|uniref:Uncharacterized protein n=1 Tax=Cochliobolus carbonum (strain 26-R-13) TaxID=930089 RepID=W6YT96_COCC2|nr:uncharacterized protein COCCADRAFT_92663 [Bipolaris zeicola 26-R-13]EUC34721.1 hypothetical protein COCCADRAFT_92663 [Bipolaris zeicola 26-R-13]
MLTADPSSSRLLPPKPSIRSDTPSLSCLLCRTRTRCWIACALATQCYGINTRPTSKSTSNVP